MKQPYVTHMHPAGISEMTSNFISLRHSAAQLNQPLIASKMALTAIKGALDRADALAFDQTTMGGFVEELVGRAEVLTNVVRIAQDVGVAGAMK